MGSLKQWFYIQPQSFLIGVAELWGVEIPKAAHKRSVEILLEAAGQEELVRDVILSCSDRAREALSFVLWKGGRTTTSLFSYRYGELRPFGPGAMEREKPWRNPQNAFEELWYKGLVMESSAKIEGKIVDTCEIPDELMPIVSSLLPSGVKVEIPEAECKCRDLPYTLAADFTMLLAYFYNRNVRAFGDGRMGKRDVQALSARIGDDSESVASGKLGFLLALATEFGFVRIDRGRFHVGRDEVVRWLDSSSAEARVELVEMWLRSRKWNDLCRIPEIRCGEDVLNDVVGARRRFLERLLRWTSPGAAYCVDDVVSAFREWEMDFQRPSGDYDDWELFDTVSGDRLSGREHWNDVEGRLLKWFLGRTMQWLGLAKGCDGCFEWSEEGRRIVDGAVSGEKPQLPEEDSAPVLWPVGGSDFVLVWNASPRQVFRACRASDWIGRTPEGLRFSFTRRSLGRAAARGVAAGQVLDFLADAGGQDAVSHFEKLIEGLSSSA